MLVCFHCLENFKWTSVTMLHQSTYKYQSIAMSKQNQETAYQTNIRSFHSFQRLQKLEFCNKFLFLLKKFFFIDHSIKWKLCMSADIKTYFQKHFYLLSFSRDWSLFSVNYSSPSTHVPLSWQLLGQMAPVISGGGATAPPSTVIHRVTSTSMITRHCSWRLSSPSLVHVMSSVN